MLIKKSYRFIVSLAFLLSGKALFTLQVAGYAFKYENSSGAVIHWFPEKKATSYKVYRSDKSQALAELKLPEYTEEFKKLMASGYKEIMTILGVQSELDLLEKLRDQNKMMQLLSIYNPKLANLLGLRYEDTSTLDVGKKYTYTVEAWNGDKIVDKGKSPVIEPGKFPEIPAPTEILAAADDKSARISWKKIKNSEIIAFNIYIRKDSEEKFQKANETPISALEMTATVVPDKEAKGKQGKKPKNLPKAKKETGSESYTIENLKPGQKYIVKLRSLHFNFMESADSEIVEVVPKDLNLPPIPTIKEIKQKEITPTATIFWELKSEYVHASHYDIYRSNKPEKDYIKINKVPLPAQTTEYTDTQILDYEKIYYYRVTLSSKDGIESPLSGAKLFRPEKKTKPGSVTIKELTAQPGAIKLILQKGVDKDIFGYDIWRALSIQGEYSVITRLKPNSLHYIDKDLDARGIYCYKIQVIDSMDKRSDFSKPQCKSPENARSLNPPFNLSAIEDQGGVRISWEMPAHPLLSGFIIYRKKENERKFSKLTWNKIDPLTREYIDLTVGPGGIFEYEIRSIAENDLLSPPSESIRVETGKKRPEPIQNLRVHKKPNAIHVSWSYLGGKNVQFTVLFKDMSTGKIQKLRAGKQLEYSLTKVKPGSYEVSVEATDSRGIVSLRKEFKSIQMQ